MVIVYKTTNGWLQKKNLKASSFVCDDEYVRGNLTIFAIWAVNGNITMPVGKLKNKQHRDMLFEHLQTKEYVSVCAAFPAELTDYQAFRILYCNGISPKVLQYIFQSIDKACDAFSFFSEEEISLLKLGKTISLENKNISEISAMWADTLKTLAICKTQKITYRQFFLFVLLCFHSEVADVMNHLLLTRHEHNFSETLLAKLSQTGILFQKST